MGADLNKMRTFLHVPGNPEPHDFENVLPLAVGSHVNWGDGRHYLVTRVVLSFSHHDPVEDEGYHIYLEPVDYDYSPVSE